MNWTKETDLLFYPKQENKKLSILNKTMTVIGTPTLKDVVLVLEGQSHHEDHVTNTTVRNIFIFNRLMVHQSPGPQ